MEGRRRMDKRQLSKESMKGEKGWSTGLKSILCSNSKMTECFLQNFCWCWNSDLNTMLYIRTYFLLLLYRNSNNINMISYLLQTGLKLLPDIVSVLEGVSGSLCQHLFEWQHLVWLSDLMCQQPPDNVPKRYHKYWLISRCTNTAQFPLAGFI